MTPIPDLIPLPDGRPGLRTTLSVDVRSPSDLRENSCNSCEPSSPSPSVSGSCLDFISSDATLDRYSEIICPSGWHLENYRRNPVFQNAHKYGDIIFTLGRALITEVRDMAGRQALFQRIQFAVDANPMAKIAHALYAGGFVRAVSVGFIPLKWQDADQSSSSSYGEGQECTGELFCFALIRNEGSRGPTQVLSRLPSLRLSCYIGFIATALIAQAGLESFKCDVTADEQQVLGYVPSRSERQPELRIHLLFVRVLKGTVTF